MSAQWEFEWLDYYELLQVSPRAAVSIIEAAYRRLAQTHHPDVQGDAEFMTRLNVAKSVLTNTAERARYDVEWQARNRAATAGAEEVKRARQEQQRARAAAERARREAREARDQAEAARREAEAARQAARDQAAEREAAAAREAARDQAAEREAAAARRVAREQRQEARRAATLSDPRGSLAEQASVAAAASPPAGGSFDWLGLLGNALRAVAAAPTLSGVWRGMDGLTYTLQQSGSEVSFQGADLFGQVVTAGSGQLIGRQLQVRFRAADGTYGTAFAELSPDGRELRGMAQNVWTGMGGPIVLSR